MTTPARAAAELIDAQNRLGPIEAAVVLGRDFLSVADIAEQATSFAYADLPGFPAVPGGEATLGLVEGAPMLFLKGRVEFHESGDPSLMASAVETLAHLGASALLSTGSVVSVNADFLPATLFSVTDHINFNGLDPLIGAAGDNFVNMNGAYDKRLLRRLKQASAGAGVTLHEGVMMWFSGPSFQTPAEVKVARMLGADALGASIAPEAILARRFSVPFAAVAGITDYATGFNGGNPVYDPTRNAGLIGVRRLLRAFQKSK
jgi:purine-nucleoside phosphorylase